MKVKLKFTAKKDIIKDGKVIRTETVLDAIQAKDLDGHNIAIEGFGMEFSKKLYIAAIPDCISDPIEYKRFVEKLHDNKGDEIEVDDVYIQVLKDAIKNSNNSTIIVCAVFEFLDKALMKATEESTKK